MRAVLLKEYGSADKLVLADVPEPEAGPGEIKVRLEGASINVLDYGLRSGRLRDWMPLDLPFVLGRDGSGEVVAVGSGVTAFRVGAKVLGLAMSCYAEYAVAEEAAWAPVPPSLDLIDAAAIPVVAMTGWQLIDEAVNPRAGALVLVTGAVGSVGRAAVYAAKVRGARVLAGVRAKHRDEAAKLNVAGVVALDDEAEVARIPKLDAIANTVGGPMVESLIGKIKSGGTIGSVTGEPAGAKEAGLVVRSHVVHDDPKRLAELARAVASGELVIPIAKRLPLAQIAEAHRIAENSAGGKVVLRIR